MNRSFSKLQKDKSIKKGNQFDFPLLYLNDLRFLKLLDRVCV